MKLVAPHNHQEFASTFLCCEGLLCSIFVRFLLAEFIKQIWSSYDPGTWCYGSSQKPPTINKGKCCVKSVYTMLAVSIRICGLQNAPKPSKDRCVMR